MARLELLATLSGHTDRVWSLAWNHNGTVLASCSGDKTVRLWTKVGDQWTGCGTLDECHKRTVRSVAFSPDSRLLATASFDATTEVFRRQNASGEYVRMATLEGHENEVKSVAWAPSGALLATCGRDKSVWIWEIDADDEFECAAVLQQHTQDVKAVVWHPSEEILVSCSYDDTVKVWQEDNDDWVCTATLTGHTSTVWSAAFDATGDRLATVSDDTSLRLWRRRVSRPAPDGDAMQTDDTPASAGRSGWACTATVPHAHGRAIYSVAWSAHGVLATGAGDNAIGLFHAPPPAAVDGADTDPVVPLALVAQAHAADVNCVRWNPADPDVLASCGDDRVIKIWRLVRA